MSGMSGMGGMNCPHCRWPYGSGEGHGIGTCVPVTAEDMRRRAYRHLRDRQFRLQSTAKRLKRVDPARAIEAEAQARALYHQAARLRSTLAPRLSP